MTPGAETLHTNENGDVPLDTFAEAPPFEPQSGGSAVMEQVGFGLMVTVPEPEPVQPLVSVTVTENVPEVPELMVEVVAPVLHANVLEPVPPAAVAVSVAEAP